MGALQPSSDNIMRKWILAEQNHAHVRAHHWEVAVLPFGATEPHNLHMPYGTDIFQVEEIGDRACAKAYRAGTRCCCFRLSLSASTRIT